MKTERQIRAELFGEELAYLLENTKLSDGHADAVREILSQALSDADIGADDYELLPLTYPMLINTLHEFYVDGIDLSLRAVVEAAVRGNDELDKETEQFRATDKRIKERMNSGEKRTRREFLESFKTADSLQLGEIIAALSTIGYKLPDEVYGGIHSGLDEIVTKCNIGINPEEWSIENAQDVKTILDAAYKAQDEKVERNSRGVSCANTETSAVLDISEHGENLNVLAQDIFKILHNPLLPESVRRNIENEFSSNHIDFYTPENILGNLKEIIEQESESE